ncbi:hypothetical protein [Streptomyces sp. NPDC127036]
MALSEKWFGMRGAREAVVHDLAVEPALHNGLHDVTLSMPGASRGSWDID